MSQISVTWTDELIWITWIAQAAGLAIFDRLQEKYLNNSFHFLRVLLNLSGRIYPPRLGCSVLIWGIWLWVCPIYAARFYSDGNNLTGSLCAVLPVVCLLMYRKQIRRNFEQLAAGRAGPPAGRVAPSAPSGSPGPPPVVIRVGKEAGEHVGDAEVPDYWTNSREDIFDQMVYVSPGPGKVFGELLTNTYKPIATQDRLCPATTGKCAKTPGGCPCVRPGGKPGLPTGYVVRRIIRVEDSGMWKRYCQKRDAIRSKRSGSSDLQQISPAVLTEEVARAHPETLTQLDSKLNEVYLWHGTAIRLALAIAQNDFNINLAGSNKGTMYGRGAYLTESSTKADEYAQDEPGQYYDGVFALLLVRACLGRFYYTTTREPEAAQQVVSGECDCVLGDRAASVNTFREFVVYDSDQIYPEFIVLYSRMFQADDEAAFRKGCQVPFHMELPVYWSNCHLNPRQEAFAFQYKIKSTTQELLQKLVNATATKHTTVTIKEAYRLEVSTMWNKYVDFRSSVQNRDIPLRILGKKEAGGGDIEVCMEDEYSDTTPADEFQELCTSEAFTGRVQLIRLRCEWKDQDSGDKKGRMRIALMRGDTQVVVRDLFGVCRSNNKPGWKRAHRELTEKDPVVENAQLGDYLKVLYRVGSGDGQELHIQGFKCVVQMAESEDDAEGKVKVARCLQPNELDGQEDSGHALTSLLLDQLHAEDVISSENLDSTVNEMFLWHGTSPSAANSIIASGFRIPRGERATHGKRFGEGAYLAEDASKSLGYCSTDEAGLSYLLLCRSTCGELFYTEDGNKHNAHHEAKRANKDSVLANPNGKGPREFILMDEVQVYPEFMLKVLAQS